MGVTWPGPSWAGRVWSRFPGLGRASWPWPCFVHDGWHGVRSLSSAAYGSLRRPQPPQGAHSHPPVWRILSLDAGSQPDHGVWADGHGVLPRTDVSWGHFVLTSLRT